MRVKRVALFRRLALVLIFLGLGFLGRRASVWGAASGNAGKLIFTEVSSRDSSNDWAELYVVDGSVNWTGYRIYEGGQLRKTITSTLASNLSTGDYIVLHAETGTDETTGKGANGYWDLYGLTALNATDLILQIKEPSGSTDRVDVVIYSDDNGDFTSSATEANGAVSDGMWDSYDFSTGDAGAWTDTDDIGTDETLARYLDPGIPVYADSDRKTDWYHETNPTQGAQNDETVVELASFTATPRPGYVHLAWATDSEVDNEGFNVWRATIAGGPHTKLNASLIPAQGGPTWGASYTYDDATVTSGVTYYYKLEDVDTHGLSTFHGPMAATAGRVYRLYLPLLLRIALPTAPRS